MAEQTMRYAIEAEDRTKAGLASAQSGLAGFARQASAFAAGFGLYDIARKGLQFLGDELQSVIQSASEAQNVEAQLNAVLASTGGSAGVTAEEAKNLASRMQDLTTYNDEAVLGMENLILTTTNIKKDAFEPTTQAVLDMSVAMGQDLKSSTIQISKALNDPINNLAALTRVNVTFTDGQKETIKTLQESGDLFGAQKIVLQELNKEFGGSAAAAANTFQGRMMQLNNTLDDVKENIGKALMPGLEVLLGAVNDTAKSTKEASANNEELAKHFYQGAQVALAFTDGLKAVGQVLMGVGILSGDAASLIVGMFNDSVNAAGQFGSSLSKIGTALSQLTKGDFAAAASTLKGAFSFSFPETRAGLSTIKDDFSKTMDGLGKTADAAAAHWQEAWDLKGFKPVQGSLSNLNKSLGNSGDAADKAAKKMSEAFVKAATDIKEKASDTQGKIADLIDSYGQKTADNLEKHLDRIKDFNTKLKDTQTDYQVSTIQNEGDYNAQRLDLFMGHQDKLADLQSKSQDLRTRLGEEQDSEKKAQLTQQVNEVKKQIAAEEAVIDQNEDLRSKAAQYRNTTDLERLKASYEEKQVADKKAFEVKMAGIQDEIAQENMEYQKQTDQLRADTSKRFDDILNEYVKGYQKIITESKAKGKEIAVLQAQAKTDLDQLISTATTALGIVSGTRNNVGTASAKSTGAPQFNFTFTGTVTDKDTLVKTILDAVNRANSVASAARAF